MKAEEWVKTELKGLVAEGNLKEGPIPRSETHIILSGGVMLGVKKGRDELPIRKEIKDKLMEVFPTGSYVSVRYHEDPYITKDCIGELYSKFDLGKNEVLSEEIVTIEIGKFCDFFREILEDERKDIGEKLEAMVKRDQEKNWGLSTYFDCIKFYLQDRYSIDFGKF